MNATSTLVLPQQCMIEVILRSDGSNDIVTPAYFTDDVIKFMLNRKLIALQSFCDADIPYSPLSPRLQVVPQALFTQLTLTLLREDGNGSKGGDFYSKIPLTFLRRVVNGSVTLPSATDLWRCDPVGISWSDSFLQSGNPYSLQNDVSVPFLATFLLPEQNPAPYRVIKLKR